MREYWTLDPDVVHLNHGSFGAVPRITQEAQQRLRHEAEHNPMQWFRNRAGRLHDTRAAVASYLDTAAANLALVPNASTGVTSALRAVPARPGQRFLLTDHAYGSVRFAAERIAKQSGCTVDVVDIPLDADDDQVLTRLRKAMHEHTACVVVDEIASATTKVFPTRRIAALGKEAGVPVIVDGAHAPGLVDSPVVGDFWTGNLHKWPCAPRGTAALYVDPAYQHLTPSPTVSWGERDGYPASFDIQGTVDDTGWFAAPTSLDLLTDLGFPEQRARLRQMLDDGAAAIAAATGQRVLDVGSSPPTMRLLSLPPALLPDEAAKDQVQATLAADTGVEVSLPWWNGTGYLRISAHLYNKPEDYTIAAERYATAFASTEALAAR